MGFSKTPPAQRAPLCVVAPSPIEFSREPVRVAGESVQSDAEQTPADRQASNQPGILHDLTRAVRTWMSSWLVSLAVHLLLMVFLTLLTLGAAGTDLGLEMAFTESVGPMDSISVDFELASDESDAMSQDLESLEVNELQESETPIAELDDSLFAEPVSFDSTIPSMPEGDLGLAATADSEGGGEGEPTAEMAPGSGTRFYGIESTGSRFVFVIDCSGSMASGYRWDRAVTELVSAIQMLESDQEFLVMTYNRSAHVMMNAPLDEVRLIRATTSNKRKLRRWLVAQQPNDVTMPAGAMMVGLAMNVDAIFLLSDGELRDNTAEMLRVRNKPRMLRYGGGKVTPVHTVAMDTHGEGADLLRQIAAQNDGVFKAVQ